MTNETYTTAGRDALYFTTVCSPAAAWGGAMRLLWVVAVLAAARGARAALDATLKVTFLRHQVCVWPHQHFNSSQRPLSNLRPSNLPRVALRPAGRGERCVCTVLHTPLAALE
mgnify:CR=1 FL=1